VITYVIPCGAGKLDRPAPARDLYTGAMFKHTLATALAEAGATDGRVLILSARYGLVELGTVLAPYEQRMGQPGAITPVALAAQALAYGIDWGSEVYAFLPKAYFAPLSEALHMLDVYPQDVYEATAGIGEQRHVNAVVMAHR